MAAGLGFKDFVTGEVLTAADVDGYLMQGVWVFASATARDAAVTSPQEGNFAYLKDTNVTTYYTGSAWANLDTTGMTNPMTTTGDMIYSSSGSTPARLGLGTASQQLRVNAGATAPEWFTPAAASSALTYLGGSTFSAQTAVSINNVFSATYQNYVIFYSIKNDSGGALGGRFRYRVAGADDTSANYDLANYNFVAGSGGQSLNQTAASFGDIDTSLTVGQLNVFDPFGTVKTNSMANAVMYGGAIESVTRSCNFDATTSFTGITFFNSSSTNISGDIRVYGLANS